MVVTHDPVDGQGATTDAPPAADPAAPAGGGETAGRDVVAIAAGREGRAQAPRRYHHPGGWRQCPQVLL